MKSVVLGVATGILATVILSLLLSVGLIVILAKFRGADPTSVQELTDLIQEFSPVLIVSIIILLPLSSGFVTGFLVKKKGWLYGILPMAIVLMFSSLNEALYPVSHLVSPPKFWALVLAPLLVALSLASLGGFLGERLSRRK